MNVTVAKTAGFCFGVRRALELTEESAAKQPTCTLGELIHNRQVVQELARQGLAVPVCPEQLGGLPTPRAPSERQGERVVSSLGADVTAQYRRGAEEALRLAELYGCTTAVLKERSPSCGSGAIYDGTFTGTVTEGWGTAAALLRRHGVRVLGESQLASLLEELGSTQ